MAPRPPPDQVLTISSNASNVNLVYFEKKKLEHK